jgi:hypothetical protein
VNVSVKTVISPSVAVCVLASTLSCPSPPRRNRSEVKIRRLMMAAGGTASLVLATAGTALAASGASTNAQDLGAAGANARAAASSHATSVKLPSRLPARASMGPLYETSVSPRTSCGGFNGNIDWGGVGSVAYPAYIHVWGKLWNNGCPGATIYLYVNYTLGSGQYGPQIAKATYSATGNVGVNWETTSEYELSYGHITVDVCDNSGGGWHCGAPQGPG